MLHTLSSSSPLPSSSSSSSSKPIQTKKQRGTRGWHPTVTSWLNGEHISRPVRRRGMVLMPRQEIILQQRANTPTVRNLLFPLHSIHPSIRPSIHPSIHLSIYPPICPFVRLSIHTSINSSIHLHIHPFTHSWKLVDEMMGIFEILIIVTILIIKLLLLRRINENSLIILH